MSGDEKLIPVGKSVVRTKPQNPHEIHCVGIVERSDSGVSWAYSVRWPCNPVVNPVSHRVGEIRLATKHEIMYQQGTPAGMTFKAAATVPIALLEAAISHALGRATLNHEELCTRLGCLTVAERTLVSDGIERMLGCNRLTLISGVGYRMPNRRK